MTERHDMPPVSIPPQLAREADDPIEGTGRVPRLYVAFLGTMIALGATYLVRYSGGDFAIAGDRRSPQSIEPQVVTGESLFQRNCATCHQANGRGVAGAFPPLAGSPWLLREPETPIRVVLMGLSGSIDVEGATYNGAMPPFRDVLSDRELAMILTHARGSFGNQAPPIAEADVGKVRASLAGRTQSWAGGAALEEARASKVLP